MERIKENWKRIEEIEEEVREKTKDPNAGFNSDVFFIKGRKLMIPCVYKKPKGEDFTKKTYDMFVMAKYCPFTGKPLYEDKGGE